MNSIFLSGMIKRVYWSPAGSQKKGGGTSAYPRLSVVFSWENVPILINGQQYILDNQESWVSVSVPTLRGQGEQRPPDIQKIEGFKASAEGQFPYAMVMDATYNVWGNPPKPEVRMNFFDLRTSPQPISKLNRVIISGKAGSQNDQWLYVEERYHVPGRGKKSGWQVRMIPVFLPTPMASLTGRQVVVFGALSSQALVWQGGQFITQKYLHVVAQEVHAC